MAKTKRADGMRVVLQDINGVNNVDACTNKYADTIFLLGRGPS